MALLGYLVFAGVIQLSAMQTNGVKRYAPVREYCESDSFKAKCWINEVIVMQTALYGRMTIGKCVEADLGYLGCKADVLELADKSCSGRRECEVGVPNSIFDRTKPCYKELKVYLEASYNCVKVLNAQQHHCHSAVKIPVSSDTGHISSLTSAETHCGTRKAPWILEGQPGQKLNLTLVDFGWKSTPSTHESQCKPVYGYIYDPENKQNITLCGGRKQREKLIYQSAGSNVTVVLLAQNKDSEYQFLIRYTAEGCPNLRPPRDAWLKRDGNEAVVGCDETRQTWHLTCNGKQWVGVIGNCTQHLVAARKEAMIASSTFTMPHGVAIFVIVAVALIISCIIIIIGMIFIRRYKKSMCKSKKQVKYNGVKTYEDKIKQQAQVSVVSDSPQRHRQRSEGNPGNYLRKNDYTATQHIWEYPLPDPTTNNNMQTKEHNTSGSNTTTTGYGGSINTAHTFTSGDDPYGSSRYPASHAESGRYFVLDQHALDSAMENELI